MCRVPRQSDPTSMVIPRDGDPVRNVVKCHRGIIWNPQVRGAERFGLVLHAPFNHCQSIRVGHGKVALSDPTRHDLETPCLWLFRIRQVLD